MIQTKGTDSVVVTSLTVIHSLIGDPAMRMRQAGCGGERFRSTFSPPW